MRYRISDPADHLLPLLECSRAILKSTCLEPDFFSSLHSHQTCFCTAYPNSVHGDTILPVRTGTKVKQVSCLGTKFKTGYYASANTAFAWSWKWAFWKCMFSIPHSPHPGPTLLSPAQAKKPQHHPLCLCFSDIHVPSVRKSCWLYHQKERGMP